MKRLTAILAMMVCLAVLAGCAPTAKEQFAKVEPGMNREQVTSALGQPEYITTVRFSGHAQDFEIWQYTMTPDVPLCPSDMIISAFTLGLSNLARTDKEPKPHWVYFQEGLMVYTSPAFDCTSGEICKITGKFTRPGTY